LRQERLISLTVFFSQVHSNKISERFKVHIDRSDQKNNIEKSMAKPLNLW